MEIPVKNVLVKMNQEVQMALRTENEAEIRAHLLVIQTLCSLVVEQESRGELITKVAPPISNFPQSKLTESRVDEEEDSDSLFDF